MKLRAQVAALIIALLSPFAAIVATAQHLGEEIDIEAVKVVLQFDGTTLQPPSVLFNKRDSSVFFVNNSAAGTPVHLAIDFRGKQLHCHSKNLTLDDEGFLRTVQPIRAFDFAILCFPQVGIYSLKVSETKGQRRSFTAEVVVDDSDS